MEKFKISIFFVGFLIAGFSGCVSTQGYKTSITKFQSASAVVIAGSRSYLSEVNKIARDAYLEDCIRNKEGVNLKKLYEAQPLSAQALSLRLKMLQELTRYGQLFYQLANDNAPQGLRAGFEGLGVSLEKINKDVMKDSNESGKEFGKSIGPISKIFGGIAQALMKDHIQEALDKAVKAAEGPIAELIMTIGDDVVVAYDQKMDIYSERRAFFVDKYNAAVKKGEDESSLRARAQELKASLDLYETLVSTNPKEGFDAMISAHKALVDYAKSSKKPKDFAAFAQAMDSFVSSAKVINDAVVELKKEKL